MKPAKTFEEFRKRHFDHLSRDLLRMERRFVDLAEAYSEDGDKQTVIICYKKADIVSISRKLAQAEAKKKVSA